MLIQEKKIQNSFMNATDAAKITGLDVRCILKRFKSGEIPTKKFGNRYKTNSRWLAEWSNRPDIITTAKKKTDSKNNNQDGKDVFAKYLQRSKQ